MVDIREPRTAREFEQYYDLRFRLLREPWNQQRGSEKDCFEDVAIHAIALQGDQIVGGGRLHLISNGEAQVRYMTTSKDFQGKGIGKSILTYLEMRASDYSVRSIVLNAREDVV